MLAHFIGLQKNTKQEEEQQQEQKWMDGWMDGRMIDCLNTDITLDEDNQSIGAITLHNMYYICKKKETKQKLSLSRSTPLSATGTFF